VLEECGEFFFPEVAEPRCLQPTQYPIETGNRLNTNPALVSLTQGIHQVPLKNFGVYSSFATATDSNYAITSPISSIPQAAIESFGLCSAAGDIPDLHLTSPLSNESIHQAPLIQGGSGLLYTFLKGESSIDHYRYKVKINGKLKVRSVYIPVGNLLEVREAVLKNLEVAVIVI
jgi:hypothetical protein